MVLRMSDNERPLFADLRNDVQSLAVALRDMAATRWQLARLELVAQSKQLGSLVAVIFVSLVMVMTTLPLFVWCLADWLDGWHAIPRIVWLLAFAGGLFVTALLSTGCAVRRFRRQAVGLQETMEELREDLVWFREWTGRKSFGSDLPKDGPAANRDKS
jgi:uncharacterized membrane protein YqjE